MFREGPQYFEWGTAAHSGPGVESGVVVVREPAGVSLAELGPRAVPPEPVELTG